MFAFILSKTATAASDGRWPEKALAQSLGQPTLTALAATILARRKAYYDALEKANRSNGITPNWFVWFAATAAEAQRRTIVGVEFLIEKTRLLDRLRGELNPRQERRCSGMFAARVPKGSSGGLSAGNYAPDSRGLRQPRLPATLRAWLDKGAMVRRGDLKQARYYIALTQETEAFG